MIRRLASDSAWRRRRPGPRAGRARGGRQRARGTDRAATALAGLQDRHFKLATQVTGVSSVASHGGPEHRPIVCAQAQQPARGTTDGPGLDSWLQPLDY